MEVRSKFQTARRMRDASRGVEVEVPFDNALVRYLWVSERELRVTEVFPCPANFDLARQGLELAGGEEEAEEDGEKNEAEAAAAAPGI